MSKNNINQNYNERNNDIREKGGRYKDRKNTRQPKLRHNEIKVPLYLSADLDENMTNSIIDVLSETKFNRISIPLGIYRCLIDNTVDSDDLRVCTIGYIRGYDAETREFTVTIFNKFIDVVKGQGDVVVDLQFTTYKDSLGSITKFNIVPVVYEESAE